jgi:hypothetical protein
MWPVPMMHVPHLLANDKGIKSPDPLSSADIENANVHMWSSQTVRSLILEHSLFTNDGSCNVMQG